MSGTDGNVVVDAALVVTNTLKLEADRYFAFFTFSLLFSIAQLIFRDLPENFVMSSPPPRYFSEHW